MALVKVCDVHDLGEWWVEVEATRVRDRRQELRARSLREHNAALTAALQPYVDAGRKVPRAGLR